MFFVQRHPENPILAPKREQPWQAHATFNPSVIKTHEGMRMYYRALANPAAIVAPFAPQSTIGLTESKDGVHFTRDRQVIAPKEEWEAFGCEDPRATVINGTTYITYTALGGFPFGPDNIKAAIAISKDGEHFDERHLVTPFNAKAFTLFPEKIGDEYVAILTAHTDYTNEHPRPTIGIARAKIIEDFWNPEFWHAWHADLPSRAIDDLRRSDADHVEVGAPPILTKHGWLLIYSYIQHYYDEHKRTFGIEAVLLDAKDPRKVTSRTYPFLVPEEIYERYGVVSNIVFPTSAVVEEDGMLDIFYGAADTTCARARIRLSDLLDSLRPDEAPVFTRAAENPILLPKKENSFEEKLVFNPAAFMLDGKVHILYRAMDNLNTSVMGYAVSTDGIHIDERLSSPAYVPRTDFEKKNGKPDGNSGCEDPRTSIIGDRLYMTYTAYDGVRSPKGAITSISLNDFRARKFDAWETPFIITPDEFDDKDLSLLPEKQKDGYLIYHRVSGRICADILRELSPDTKVTRCIEIMGPRAGMWDAAKVGIAGPPLRVPGGWLFLYHGVSWRGRYRVGAALLDETGTTVIARSADPVFEPVEPYELFGEIPNVVFPCGSVIRDDTLYMYYGGADTVVGVATASLSRILAALS
jgi:beta-1,2-mannobiose phosphorylase / 1,2-beta-oligomannan phosphorylase